MNDSTDTEQPNGAGSSPQILGAHLIGMIQSFDNTCALSVEDLSFETSSLQLLEWYPFSYALEMVELIKTTLPNMSSLLFWAGVRFINRWYYEGPGKEVIFSSIDWVKANQTSDSYNTVVKGDPQEVGWTGAVEIDLDQGYALIELVMPWEPAYLQGVLYGGFLLFDDLLYFNSEVVSVTQEDHLPFQRILVKLSFIQESQVLDEHSYKALAVQESQSTLNQFETLKKRYQHSDHLNKLQKGYIQDMEGLVKKTFVDIKIKQTELIELNRQLKIEAFTDSLTGLNNKRFFYQQVGQLCSVANRHKHSLFVMLIDIDYFKLFNDYYGHLEGDKAIKEVADCIRKVFKRGEDITCRFGGEEFVCVSLCINDGDINKLAERLRQNIVEQNVLHARSKIADYLTVSIGTAAAKPGEIDIEILLSQADKALYEAKRNGRNCHITA